MENESFMRCVEFYEKYQRYPNDYEFEEKKLFSQFSEKDFEMMDIIIDFIFTFSRLPSISCKKERGMCNWISEKQHEFDEINFLIHSLGKMRI